MIQFAYKCAGLWRKNLKPILVILFIVNSLLFIFSFVKTSYTEPPKVVQKEINLKQLKDSDSPQAVKSKKLVVLFTTKRSGSSFAGELLNRISNSFYLFEPLFPFTRRCDILKEERVATLQALLQCQFENMTDIYKSTFRLTKHSDEFAKCMDNSICFIERHKIILDRYKRLCKSKQSTQRRRESCDKSPIDFKLLSQICSSSRVIAVKILRICDISTLQGLAERVEKQSNAQLKIIHLIRDPRAIVASRLLLKYDDTSNKTIRETASLLCQRLSNNVHYTDEYWRGRNNFYFRVRFEDLAIDPLAMAQEIYNFIGESFPVSVQSWLNSMVEEKKISNQNIHEKAIKESKETFDDHFDLDRRPSEVVNSWRKTLGIKEVLKVQEVCGEAMAQLGYGKVSNEVELSSINRNILF